MFATSFFICGTLKQSNTINSVYIYKLINIKNHLEPSVPPSSAGGSSSGSSSSSPPSASASSSPPSP